MAKAATIRWIAKWAGQYPIGSDVAVEHLAGRDAFGHKELAVIYNWKYRRLWPAKHVRNLTTGCTNAEALDWTQRAFASEDLAALCVTSMLPGANAAGASAVLMASQPWRFTVMDPRAIASLTLLGRWSPSIKGSGASYRYWVDYLEQCRKLAVLANVSLRTLDRALYESNGRP